jgi:hypothetical protein
VFPVKFSQLCCVIENIHNKILAGGKSGKQLRAASVGLIWAMPTPPPPEGHCECGGCRQSSLGGLFGLAKKVLKQYKLAELCPLGDKVF